jgi:hypothetical protein
MSIWYGSALPPLSEEALEQLRNGANQIRPGGIVHCTDKRTSEQIMVDIIRADLGVIIEPQAWRMFLRHRFDRMSTLAHRIHDGKR